jgi:Tol biopolymer transport system component
MVSFPSRSLRIPLCTNSHPFSLSISPDGHWLAFGRSVHTTGDLTMEFAVCDLRSGSTTRIATYNYGNPNPVNVTARVHIYLVTKADHETVPPL